MPKLKIPAALLVIGAISLGAPAIAAPLTSLSAAVKSTAQDNDLVQVRFGGWHGGAGFAAGALAGALVGAAIAAPYYGGGYYPYHGYGYSYGYPAYYDNWAPEAYPTYGNNPWNNPYYRWGG